MRITLSYFDGCPNWQIAYERLTQALATTGHKDLVIELVPVTSEEEAVAVGFAGSPTIYIDGAPSLDQLVASLTGVK